jgi:hypothetical protein
VDLGAFAPFSQDASKSCLVPSARCLRTAIDLKLYCEVCMGAFAPRFLSISTTLFRLPLPRPFFLITLRLAVLSPLSNVSAVSTVSNENLFCVLTGFACLGVKLARWYLFVGDFDGVHFAPICVDETVLERFFVFGVLGTADIFRIFGYYHGSGSYGDCLFCD